MSALTESLAPIASWWQGLARRERRLVVGVGVLVAALLVWQLALVPAVRTIGRAPAEIDAADGQLQTMHRLAAEARELRALAPVPPEQAAAALNAATARLGEKARLVLQADRAVLTLNGVGSTALGDWLTEARTGARARPVEASLSRGAQGLNGTVVVALGSRP